VLLVVLVAIATIVIVVTPLLEGCLFDEEFNGVVTGGDGTHIPLKLVNLAAVVKPTQEDLEETARDQTAQHDAAKLVVFGFLLILAHDA